MKVSKEYFADSTSTARRERLSYSDGTIAFVFTGSSSGGDVIFGDYRTHSPSIPQSPKETMPMIIDTVDNVRYVMGRGVIIDGETGIPYDISQIGRHDFPDRVTIGQPFEIPSIGLSTSEVAVFGVEHLRGYAAVESLGGTESELSPFRQASIALEQASQHLDELFPDRRRTLYRRDTGEAYIKKPESLFREALRAIIER